jgi:hypothetical protein
MYKRANKRNNYNIINTFSPFSASRLAMNKHKKNTNSKKRQKRPKRRIRTFYSKKWGNKLFGLTKHYPIITNNNNNIDINDTRRSLSAFIEEENLDLNDLKSPTRSPSPSVPMDGNHLNIDFRFHENLNYDSAVSAVSAVSNVAANNDNESDLEDRFCNSDKRNLKIIVSAPNREQEQEMEMERERAREREIYLSSDNEHSESASEDFSSSEDDDCGCDIDNIFSKSSLFLGCNNMNVGVYSDFGYSDQSETDYLSAQSGDFDELTICYHYDKNKNRNRNIRFRENYLSDIGPSDIGSSDTEYFSSADSIPDSVPDSIPDSIPKLQKL